MKTAEQGQVDLKLIDETFRRWKEIKSTFEWGVGLTEEESNELRTLRAMRDRELHPEREHQIQTTLRVWELLAKRGG